jgi:hypothetical protein
MIKGGGQLRGVRIEESRRNCERDEGKGKKCK